MKIGIDIRAIGQQRTGDEYYTLNLVRGLLKIDRKNQYYLLTNTFQTENIEKKIFAGLKNENVKIIPVMPKSKLFWTFFALPKVAKQLNLDVLHVQYITPLLLPRKIKLVTTIADVSFKAFPELINKVDLFLLKIFIPLSLKKADKIIAVSKFTKNEIIKYYGIKKDKISAIYNGEASDIFLKKGKKSTKTLEKIGIKKPYLFYVGTHQPRKDIPNLIEAFFELKKNSENIIRSGKQGARQSNSLKLVIGGKLKAHNYDPRIDEVLREAQRDPEKKEYLKDLIFTGYLENEDLVDLYREAEIFVFPSLYEGFGLPLIEAMISDVPVVCSDIDCFKEVAGSAAEFFKAGDKKSLQEILEKVIINKQCRKKMIEKGRENAKRFSWGKTAKETLKILEK